MVQRFLSWKLPANFNPDAGISFKPEFNEHTDHPMRHEPVGTNLLDYTQAEEMVRHMLDGAPLLAREQAASPPPVEGAIPDGMKPWHGGDAAPEDWDGGPVARRDGRLVSDNEWFSWLHEAEPRKCDIIAYTPKATASPPLEVLEALRRLNKASKAVLEAVDAYNEKNGTYLGGPCMFELGRSIAVAESALIAEHDATKGAALK